MRKKYEKKMASFNQRALPRKELQPKLDSLQLATGTATKKAMAPVKTQVAATPAERQQVQPAMGVIAEPLAAGTEDSGTAGVIDAAELADRLLDACMVEGGQYDHLA